MKELSIEEKAKAYDEALKVIKGCNPDENGFITIYPQEIFPELNVSNDERIRNGLIKLLNCIAAIEYEDTFGITKEEALEWVKNHGEDKSILCSDGTVDNSLEGIINAAIYWGKEAPTENGRILEDKVKGAVDYYCSLIRNNDGWSKEDEETFSYLEDIVNFCYCNQYVVNVQTCEKVKQLVFRLKSLCFQPEWSKDDITSIDEIIETLNIVQENRVRTQRMHYNKATIDNLIAWLKSLKYRAQPQPKQEWSEKDLTRFNDVIRIIEGSDNVASIKKHYVDFLKSIMQRSIPQSTWKPSEGQLECLGYAIEKAEKDWSPLTNNRIYLTLKALKEQLKKLREE